MSLGTSGLRAMALGGLAALMVVALGASSAWAAPSTYCVKATKVLTPKKHFTGGWNNKSCTSVNPTHEGKFEKLASFTEPEEQQLKTLLKYLTVQAKGVGGQPTVKLTGANLQVASGPKEAETNGVGNVVIGVDELPKAQTGSNNLVIGGVEQEFTSYGGILGGEINKITGPFASVTGGLINEASATFASVTGGEENKATSLYSSVSGGERNTASNTNASVSGGGENTASAETASISGGRLGTASGAFSSVSGGLHDTASGVVASVAGGGNNSATGELASVSGGGGNKAETPKSWIGGGEANEVFSKAVLGEEGEYASIFGGKRNNTAKNYDAIP